MSEYIIRKMVRKEVDLAIDWAAQEGWNPGLYDADCFWAVDPEGWWIGLLDGVPICLKSAVAYDEQFGFMGFYITAPAYRGQGYGFELWKQAHQSLLPRNIGMDGVVEQQANYQKSGYHYAYRQMRYRGDKPCASVSNQCLINLNSQSIELLSAYDRKHFPATRNAFLKLWISRPETLALGYKDAGELKGYGVLRRCHEGHKIGPLFADTSEIAEILFQALVNHANGPYFLDIPEPNSDACELVKRHDMQFIFETARMYTQTPPNINLNQTFGVTSFELG